MNKKIIYTIFILIFTGIFALGAFQIYRQLKEYEEGDSAYTDVEQYVTVEEDPEDGQKDENPSGENTNTNWPAVDLAALKEINPDIVAWVCIEDTEINYPVVQGTDNQYYLKHLFNGKWNSSGCIFLDRRNEPDFSDRHSIIYGHHMKNGTMFSGLTQYKKQEFYQAHPTILLITPEPDTKFEAWLEAARSRSCFESDMIPAVTDRIVTLSTCSYEFNNTRFVLLGIVQ
jgi:sortase B